MPASTISKSKASSKSKEKKSESKDKKSESKDKKSDKKDKDKKSEKKSEKKTDKSERDKSVKSDKKSKSSPDKKSEKKEKKDKDAKSSKSKKKDKEDLNASTSQIDMEIKDVNIVDVDPTRTQQMPQLQNMNFGVTDGMLPHRMNQSHQMDRKTFCFLHKQILRYFCVSCDELICYDCTVMGPHNTQLHRISSIDDAFRDRFDGINKVIHQSLVPKRAQLIGQIVRLDHRLDEIKAVKNVIEKDIRDEYAAIMSRLKSAEGVKLAILQYDIAEVQKDITRIDEILMSMEEIASGDIPEVDQTTQIPVNLGPDQLQFLHKYRQLSDNIEYAVTKHFKVDVDVIPNDLPRELAERRVLMDHYEEQRKLLKFKDDVILKLSQELKKKYDYFQDEFDKETRNEMNEWARLVDRYGAELKKFDIVCAFCGQHLSDQNVNTECTENIPALVKGKSHVSNNSLNMGSDLGQPIFYYTEEDPHLDCIGKKKHFFAKPSQKGSQGMRNAQGTAAFNITDGQFVNNYSNPVAQGSQDSRDALQKICNSQNDLRTRFENQFRNLDHDQQGVVRKDDFVNSLFDIAKGILLPAQILSIIQHFTSNMDEVVNYNEFLKLLDRAKLASTYGGSVTDEYSQQDDVGPHIRELVMQKIANLSRSDRAVVEKLRQICKQSIKEQHIELSNLFIKFAERGTDRLSADELLIAMSRVSSDINLGEVRELHRIVLGYAPGTTGLRGFQESKVPIGELIQILTV